MFLKIVGKNPFLLTIFIDDIEIQRVFKLYEKDLYKKGLSKNEVLLEEISSLNKVKINLNTIKEIKTFDNFIVVNELLNILKTSKPPK